MTQRSPRVGLVLGGGGVTGGAFHAGVPSALHAALGWDPRNATIMVGTSAGSVAATSLRGGLSAADLLARAEGSRLSPERCALDAQRWPDEFPSECAKCLAELEREIRNEKFTLAELDEEEQNVDRLRRWRREIHLPRPVRVGSRGSHTTTTT